MAKASAFGDKVKGKIRTHKRMVKYILPVKSDEKNLKFKEGMLVVPEDVDHADHIKAKLQEIL